ncbi:MAG: glycosyltransferase family 2 protein [Christensenella sp.]|uniref:glycosyltransferase family 2 protein n=1 Tax=Christensenella sp. TaxID=1935934 RepID=UPI002B21E869|nr:glycosyltransferase family 2 protein [Christensenella sp.]MEA5002213.1 glycosyltransferase family 2 protein [Christensenella sp.]
MNVWFVICQWVVIILSVYSAPLMIWLVITAFAGLLPSKELQQKEEKQHRFAVLVCARNEERVIGNLIASLRAQDYDKDRYRIFVVADNCTDKTADVSREYGATVYERFDAEKRGKGFALHFGVNRLLAEHRDDFDALCVFDADNLAAKDFLTEMNLALCSDADVAIGYRDTKNIHDSWISEVYSVYWLMLQRFYHGARHKLGFSSMVGGTGFAFKLDILGKEGWTTYSLTEDVEFSIQQICAGKKILPAKKAVFYDEQPTTAGVSVKQRFRWMVGGMQCIPLYFSKIVKKIAGGDLKALDLLWYVFFIPATGLALPLNVAVIAMMFLNPGLYPFSVPVLIGMVIGNWVAAMATAVLTLALEKRKIRPMLRAVALYPVFMISMMVIALAAIFNPRTEWVPIEHSSEHKIEDIEKAKRVLEEPGERL